MADHCIFCETRRPEGGTNILILGDNWLEFCKPCGEKEMLTNSQTGEEKSIREVFDMTKSTKEDDNAQLGENTIGG